MLKDKIYKSIPLGWGGGLQMLFLQGQYKTIFHKVSE